MEVEKMGGRNHIPVNLKLGNITNEEKKRRQEIEEKLKGNNDNIYIPEHLNNKQKKYFMAILQELEELNFVNNLDVYVISVAAIAIDRLQEMEQKINEDFSLLQENWIRSARSAYVKDMNNAFAQLCLTQLQKAKLAGLIKNEDDDKNLLLQILSE